MSVGFFQLERVGTTFPHLFFEDSVYWCILMYYISLYGYAIQIVIMRSESQMRSWTFFPRKGAA